MASETDFINNIGELKQFLATIDDDVAYVFGMIMQNGQPHGSCIVTRVTYVPSEPGAPGALTFEVTPGQD